MLPADEVEALERLVDEIERMSAVGERPLGLGRQKRLRECSGREAFRDRRQQRALGCLAMTHFRPAPQPALERGRVGPASERRAFPPRRLAVAIRRHAARPMEQGEMDILLAQHGQEIGKRRVYGKPGVPAIAVPRPEQRHLPHDLGSRNAGRKLSLHRFGDDETKVMGEAVGKPLTPMRGGIPMVEAGLDPNLAIAHLDRARRCVVRPQIESAAAFEIEARVVPMAGQDAILDTAALERKAHMGAAIVEGKDAPLIVDHEDRPMHAVHDEPPFCL